MEDDVGLMEVERCCCCCLDVQGSGVRCRGASSEKALTTVLERVVIRMVVVVTAIRDIICSRFLIAHGLTSKFN